MNIKLVLIFASIVILSMLASCHRCSDRTNPACSNYNPCNNEQATTAQFTIMEFSDTSLLSDVGLRRYWKFFDTDSAWQRVTFTAVLDSAIYEWHIGTGVYSTKSLTLDFSAAPHPSIIPITLIVKKAHNQKCFPNGKDADTLVRNLIITYGSANNFFGTYQGTFTDSNSSFITFSIINKPDITGYPHYYIVNFFAPSDSSEISLNPNLMTIEQNFVQCNNGHPVSFIDYVKNGSAQLVFEFYTPPSANGRIRVFKGQKF